MININFISYDYYNQYTQDKKHFLSPNHNSIKDNSIIHSIERAKWMIRSLIKPQLIDIEWMSEWQGLFGFGQ